MYSIITTTWDVFFGTLVHLSFTSISFRLPYSPITTIIEHDTCMIGWNMLTSPILREYYTPHCFTVSFLIPITIMIFCYTRMYLALRASVRFSAPSRQSKQLDGTSVLHKSRLAQLNIFQTCLILATLTTVCWLTNVSALFLFMIGYYSSLSNVHIDVGFLLLLSNAMLNPYVSIMRYHAFKEQMKVCCRGKYLTNSTNTGTVQTNS